MSDPGVRAISEKADANEEVACPVTLVVSGNIVTGHVVAQDAFEADASRMVEMIRERSGAENEAVDIMNDLVSAMTAAMEGDADSGQFVHMSVQKVMTGADVIELGGSIFRFRASEIEGFTIGTVETREG